MTQTAHVIRRKAMETKFNSQICTTREQSERLLALGLKRETADMVWTHAYYSTWVATAKENPLYFHEADEDTIPAWSLHRLIEMMDLDFHTRGHYVIFEDTEFMESKNIYDNLCDCFQWLIEDNRFNKEYLV